MADFVQTMKDWRRMCQFMDKEYGNGSCDNCPLGGCSAIYEMCGNENFANMEHDIMSWAAEHPEPVYPTWGEWFVSRGMLPKQWDNLTSAYMDVGCVPNLIHSPIPADIAQKLGLRPKGEC